MNRTQTAESLFKEGYACAQSIVLAFADRYGLDDETAKRVSSTFGGGMGRLREKCGALTGAFMILGLEYGNTIPNDMPVKLDAYRRVRALDERFRAKYGTADCDALLKKHATEKQVLKREHHELICVRVVRDVAAMLEEMLEEKPEGGNLKPET